MLELRDVHAGYGGTTVLDGVDLHVGAGQVVGLLGPNGTGKTTLLRTASRLLPARSGRIDFDGRDIARLTPSRLAAAGVCHVPEGRGIFPALTVRENLQLFAGNGRRDAVDRAVDAFAFLGGRLGATAGGLSGGERQMLALSRAWLTRPKLVMLDEVSMGLAPRVVDDVYVFLRRLAGEGMALLLVEQYVDRVRAIVDDVYVLRTGRVAFHGSVDELGDDEQVLGHYLGTALTA